MYDVIPTRTKIKYVIYETNECVRVFNFNKSNNSFDSFNNGKFDMLWQYDDVYSQYAPRV